MQYKINIKAVTFQETEQNNIFWSEKYLYYLKNIQNALLNDFYAV